MQTQSSQCDLMSLNIHVICLVYSFIFLFGYFFLSFRVFNSQTQRSASFQLLYCQTRGQELFQLLNFLLVCDDQGVKVPAAANLELHIILVLLDLDRFGILSPGREQEVLDFLNFPRHGDGRSALETIQR